MYYALWLVVQLAVWLAVRLAGWLGVWLAGWLALGLAAGRTDIDDLVVRIPHLAQRLGCTQRLDD